MNPALADKDEMALEGMRVTLDGVEAVFKTLLEQIQIEVQKIDRRRNAPGFDFLTSGPILGDLMRLTVQKQTIEALRDGIPAAILEGDPSVLARVVAVH